MNNPQNYDISRDYLSLLLEEVALEGLDGITLEALWIRLSYNPRWCLNPIDANIQDFVWKKLLLLEEIRWHDLTKPRKCPTLYRTFEQFCSDVESFKIDATKISSNNYPHHLIRDGDIIGSCPSYYERIDITDEIRKMSLAEVNEKYQNRLVAVADQNVRNHVLLTGAVNPEVEMPDVSYCILERIGRARGSGELSISLNFLKNGANPTFYFWNKLRKLKLITSQFVALTKKLNNCTLFYLPKFHKNYTSEVLTAIVNVMNLIKSTPDKFVPFVDIRSMLPEEKRKLTKSDLFRRYIKFELIPYAECYPDTSPSQCNMKNGGAKIIRIAKLVDENLDPQSILKSTAEVEEHEEKLLGVLKGNRLLNRPLIVQCYNTIMSKQSDGITMAELGSFLGLNKLITRLLLKTLMKMECIVSLSLDNGRQRYYKYFCKKFENLVQENVEEQIGKPFFKDEQPEEANLPETNSDEIEFTPVKGTDNKSRKRKAEDKTKDVPNAKKACKQMSPKKCDQANKSPIKTSVPVKESIYFVRRTNIILEYVYTNQVVFSSNLIKVIKEEETKLGVAKGTPCARPVRRIVNLLTENKKIKEIKKIITEERLNKSKEVTFLCAPDVTEDHPIIQTTIASIRKDLSILYLKPSYLSNALVKKNPKFNLLRVDRSKENDVKYGFAPKFARMRILHEFFISLLYNYEGDENLNQEDCIKYIKSFCSDFDNDEKIPKCYFKEISTRMFVPSLVEYEEYGKNWISLNEIIERLPIKMLFSLVRLSYLVPGIDDFLKHPVKQFYLLRHLPFEIRSVITANKKYMLSIYNDIKNLCLIGLAQLGPKVNLTNMNLIYLNKYSTLLDTRPCPPTYFRIIPNSSYIKYTYDFAVDKSSENYWNDAFRFCVGTRLCRKKSATNIPKKSKNNRGVKTELIPFIAEKKADEILANDNGKIPGDGLGAAGYDSSLFSHFIKQWFLGNSEKSISPAFAPKMKAKPTRLKDNTQLKRMRFNLQKKKCKQRHRDVYDVKDIEALKKMRTLRSKWNKSEDEILLMSYAASCYYIPKNLSSYCPNALFRKILHEKSEISVSKTSLSCKRRIKFMMKNPLRRHNLDLYLKEIRHDNKLSKDVAENVKEIDSCVGEKDRNHRLLLLMNKLTECVFEYLFNNSKFKTGLVNTDKLEFVLPETLEEFRDQNSYEYPIKHPKKNYLPLETESDAIVSALVALIYSALFSQVDKSKHVNVNYLYQIFKRFDDNLLKQALTFVRGNRLLSLNKYCDRSKGSLLPIGKGTYHFSLTFHTILKASCNPSIFSSVYAKYLKIIAKNEIENLENNIDDLGINLILIAYFIRNKINVDITFPENIMFFNASAPAVVDPEMTVGPMFEHLESHSQQTLSLIKNTFFKKGSKVDVQDNEDSEDDDASQDKTNEIKEDSEQFDEMSDSDSEDELSAEAQEKLKQCLGPRCKMAVFLTRMQFKHNFLRFSNAYDHFLLNKFPIKFTFDREIPSLEVVAVGYNPKLCEKIEKRALYDKIKYASTELAEIVRKSFDQSRERDFALRLLEYLQVKGMTGASSRMLADEFGDLNLLSKIIQILVKKKIVLRGGSQETHYAHIDYAHCWLIPCWPKINIFHQENPSTSGETVANRVLNDKFDLLNNKHQAWLAIKPWIQVNGTLNRATLDSLLVRILTYIAKNSGLSLYSLQQKFEPALLSHWVRELVEMLCDFEAIKLCLLQAPKVSLFSKKSSVSITDAVTGFENEKSIFIEADVNCLTKLSLFIGNANYEDLMETKYAIDVSGAVNQPSEVQGQNVSQDGSQE